MAAFLQPSKEHSFYQAMQHLRNFKFNVAKKVSGTSWLYDINYYKMRMHVMESFDEGSFLLANRVEFHRCFRTEKLAPGQDPSFHEYFTRV